MNYIFDNNQEQNESLDVLDLNHNLGCISIENAFINPIDESDNKFDDKKSPSNEILDYEADGHDYWKRFKYENTSKDVLNLDNQIEPLSIFADNNSEIYSVLALDHDNGKDTYRLRKRTKFKENSNDSGELTNPKISKVNSDPLHKGTINQSNNVDETLEKTKDNILANKESSTKPKRARIYGYSRWGRKEDTRMFSLLRQLCKQEGVDIEDFYADNCKISNRHNFILGNLAFELNWRSDTQSLFKRIQNLGRDQTLSVRQIYDLKRLKRKAKQQKKEFKLENVVDSFPGKSMSTLQSAFKIYPGRYYKMKLT